METNLLKNWQNYNQRTLEAATELKMINTRVVEQLTSKQMALANAAFDVSTKYVSLVGELKDLNGYQDLVSEQTKLATEFNEQMLATARASADIIAESRERYQAWLENTMKAVRLGAAPKAA